MAVEGKKTPKFGSKNGRKWAKCLFFGVVRCWRLKLSPTGEEMTPNFAIFGQNWAKRATFPIVVKYGEKFIEITVISVKKWGKMGKIAHFWGDVESESEIFPFWAKTSKNGKISPKFKESLTKTAGKHAKFEQKWAKKSVKCSIFGGAGRALRMRYLGAKWAKMRKFNDFGH